MSPRWKFQLKNGLLFGGIMTLLFTLSDIFLNETPLAEQFLSWKFYTRVGILTVFGIFFVGYYNWREKEKENKKNA